jgi:hypothetical protein
LLIACIRARLSLLDGLHDARAGEIVAFDRDGERDLGTLDDGLTE